MIISFYIFSLVFILSNADPNRRTRQTNTELENLNDLLLTKDDIVPDGATDNNNVSNNSNESNINEVSEPFVKPSTLNNVKAVSNKNKDKVRKIFTKKVFKPKTQPLNSGVADRDTILVENNTNTIVSIPTTNPETNQTLEKKVKKVKRVKVNKKLIKVNDSESSPTESTSNPTSLDLTTEVSSDITTAIPPVPEESTITSTANPTTLVTKPTTKLASKYTKFAPKRRPLGPKVNTEKPLDEPSSQTPTIELTTNIFSESTPETLTINNNAPSTENTISTSSQEISSTTQSTYTLKLKRPTSRTTTERPLYSSTSETPTTETIKNDIPLQTTLQTSVSNNNIPSTERTTNTISVEVTPTTRSSYNPKRRRPSPRLVTERPSNIQTNGPIATDLIKNDIPTQVTVQTYTANNNDIQTTERTLDTIIVTTTTQRSYDSRRRRPSSRFITEKPLDVKVTPAITTQTYVNNNQWNSRFITEKPLELKTTPAITTQTYVNNNQWNSRFSTEKPLDVKVTPTITTRTNVNNNQWNLRFSTENPLDVKITPTITTQTYVNNNQWNSRFITEKPLDVKVTPAITTQTYVNNNQWNRGAQDRTRYFNNNQAVTTALPVTEVTQSPLRRRTTSTAPTEKPDLSKVTGTYFPTYASMNYRNDQSLLDTQSQNKKVQVPIIDSENYVYGHSGNFHYSYEGADGTKAFEKGTLRSSSKGSGQAVEGNFSYKDKDGNDYNLSYTADENGYRPVGAHLPTPPPIPPAIQRVLSILATKTTPEPVTEKIKAN